MDNTNDNLNREPTRDEVDQMPGPVLLEFGAGWCPHCQALAPQLQAELSRYPQVRHIRVEDGKGKPLGRSFRVKLWPTLVVLRDGLEQQQLVRPEAAHVRAALQSLVQAAP